MTISVEEYRGLKRRDRQVLALEDFTDADIAALEQTMAPQSSKAFDDELKQVGTVDGCQIRSLNDSDPQVMAAAFNSVGSVKPIAQFQ